MSANGRMVFGIAGKEKVEIMILNGVYRRNENTNLEIANSLPVNYQQVLKTENDKLEEYETTTCHSRSQIIQQYVTIEELRRQLVEKDRIIDENNK